MTNQMISVDTANPDPANAIHAFLCCMNKARSVGFSPPTEYLLAEHLFRRDVRVMLYSCGEKGKFSICMDDWSLSDEDDLEMILWFAERRRRRLNKAEGPRVMVEGDILVPAQPS